MRRTWRAGVLALCLLCTLTTSLAAPREEADAYVARLEEKYGFTLRSQGQFYTKNGLSYLKNIDAALSTVGEAFVREVTDFYRAAGYTCVLEMVAQTDGMEYAGQFDNRNQTATIKLVVYDMEISSSFETGMPILGLSSAVVVHEFGHMVHHALDLKRGADKVQAAWTALDDGRYVTAYAQTNFQEDFAEHFEGIISDQDRIDRALNEEKIHSVRNKVLLMDRLLRESFTRYPGLDAYYAMAEQPSPWAEEAVRQMKGAMRLPEDYRRYQSPITRGEFCALALRALSDSPHSLGWRSLLPDYELTVSRRYFSDVPPPVQTAGDGSAAVAYHVNKAFELGLVEGTGNGAFSPAAPITREQAAKLLTGVCAAMGRQTGSARPAAYSDAAAIAPWAVPYVNYVTTEGIMTGTTGGRFSPGESYSHEQAIVTLWRILNQSP